MQKMDDEQFVGLLMFVGALAAVAGVLWSYWRSGSGVEVVELADSWL